MKSFEKIELFASAAKERLRQINDKLSQIFVLGKRMFELKDAKATDVTEVKLTQGQSRNEGQN